MGQSMTPAAKKQRARRKVIQWNVLAPLLAIAALALGHGWVALGLIMSAHAVFLYPTLRPECDWLGEVVTHLSAARAREGTRSYDPTAKEVWLTIDDGPDPEDTPRLLDLLDAYGARATFFFIGAKAQALPALVAEVRSRGHTLGNHTLDHPQYWFWAYGPGAVRKQIETCQSILTDLCHGEAPEWFRAPAGFKNPWVHDEVERQGLRLACWSARGRDGVIKDQDEILSRLCQGVAPGAILLMHEGRDDGQGGRLAPQVLEKLLMWLKSNGYRCVLP